MEDPYANLLLAAISVLIGGIFYLSLSEAALVAVSRVRLRRLLEEGDRRAEAVLNLIEAPTFLSAIIIATNVLVITISCLATLYVRHRPHQGSGEEVVRLLILAVILIAAEITPKNIGASYATPIARWVVGPIRSLTWLLKPIISAVMVAGKWTLRDPGVSELHHRLLITKDELRAAVDVGEEEEVLEPDEGAMFDTALAMAETSVRRIMVPRVDVVALRATAPFDECLEVVQDSGFSRIPVYDGTIDNIIGILYANDLLRCLRSEEGTGRVARDLMREAIFIPETLPIDRVFRQLRDRRVHIAVVVGEQGGTEGIVTLEDILEELVGDIEDEHDIPTEEIQRLSENVALVAPKARIDEVNEKLHTLLPGDEHETIAGYIAGELGRIPDIGETICLGTIEVTVQGDQENPRLLVRLLTDPLDREEGESQRGSQG
ncbi:MAG: hemolysin family protein [Candidatus Zipacnadales bacterium]